MPHESSLDKPNRRTVEKLFRELTSSWNVAVKLREASDQAAKKLKKVEDELLACRRHREAKKKSVDAYRRWRDRTDDVNKKANELFQRYLAEGLTPSIKRELKNLVALANKS